MGIIKNLTKTADRQETRELSDITRTECFFVERADGWYFRINTYGSADREQPDKISQTMQFSPQAIKKLKSILGEKS